MVEGGKIREFWGHWQHEPDLTQEFERFRVRVTEVSRKVWDAFFKGSISLREKFAVISGTPFPRYEYFAYSGLCNLLDEAKTVFEVAHALQCLLWTLEGVTQGNFDYCCRQIQNAFDLSPSIMIRLVSHGKTATLYPTGAKLLDEALVESNLI